MFDKKSKVEEKPIIKNRKPFIIPQIEEETVGLRVLKPQFVKTEALSPMEGPYTKDVMIAPETTTHSDIDVAYDAFRVERKFTKEDEISRYGRAYHEFQSVDSVLNSTNYEKKKEVEVDAPKPQMGINFGVVQDEIIKEEDKLEIPSINFFELEEVPEEKEVMVNEIDPMLDNKEEFVAKPISVVPDFLSFNNAPILNEEKPIEDDYPKTIVSRRSDYQPTYETTATTFKATPNVPSFIEKEAPIIEEKNEVTYEAPIIRETPKPTQYETLKKAETAPKVIYQDKYAKYELPPLSLLDPAAPSSSEIPSWVEDKVEIINSTLQDFGVDGEVVHYTHGPTVTRYEVKLHSGVNVKKILGIEDNLKMNLCAKTIRIEAPIPGKSNCGIEVPNDKVRTVNFSEIVDREEFIKSNKPLKIALGLDIDGNPVYTDIAKMPHGLVAGGTGSGKSVCINGLIVSLLLKNKPSELKLILVDPKQVELASYQGLPHLVTPVITDPKLASESLKWACEEMDRRYKAFSTVRARDLATYNERIKADKSIKQLEYLVIIIDELADLMMTCGNDVEDSIQRITQLGRAAGIHIIVATQRPTTDVVKGTIKANIPTRIAFRVSQFVDSNTILDGGGAEQLLGRGDMLLKEVDLPVRVQGAFINDNEIMRVCDYICERYKEDYIFTHEDLQAKIKAGYGANATSGEDMNLVYEIASNVVERGTCSINNIQNNFNLGFNRAQNIVGILEEMGIVSPKKGTTGREILVTQAEVDQKFKMGE